MTMTRVGLLFLLAIAFVIPGEGLAQQSAVGQPPDFQSLEPRGLQVGGTTTLTVRGDRISADTSMVLPFAAEVRRLDDGAKTNEASFEIKLPHGSQTGYFPVRLLNSDGFSTAQYTSIDKLPNVANTESVNAEIPFAVAGNVRGDQIRTTEFVGKAKGHVTIAVEAQRLGSNLRPVIELLRPDGNILAVAHGIPQRGGDCLLFAELPEDGTYTVRVHDVLYRGGQPGFYRLKIQDAPPVDSAIPCAVSITEIENWQQARIAFVVANIPLGNVPIQAPPPVPGVYPLVDFCELFASGRAAPLFVREEPIVTEDESTTAEAALDVPHGVNGVLSEAGETDTHRFAVKPGEKIQLEVIAERAGLPLDSVIKIAAADGRVLANADDHEQSRDSKVVVDVPGDVNELHVSVTDRLRRGGDVFAYYLVASRANEPNYSLSYEVSELSVPAGAQTVFLVKANRQGYAGPIALRFSPALPSEFQLSGDSIPAGMDQALVTVSANDASATPLPKLELIGEAQIGDRTVRRYAARNPDKVAKYSPWLARYSSLATIRERSIGIAWQLPEELQPAPGETITAPVQLARGDNVGGNVRLQLLTSQVVPLFTSGPNNGKPQEAKAIRLGTAVNLAAGDSGETNVAILIPNDLPFGVYDIALAAELLSADGKRVLDRSVTPARRFSVVGPSFEIAVDANVLSQPLSGVIGEGEANVINGRITRSGGMQGPVTITLAGLPEGWAAPEVQVPAGEDTFQLALNFPHSTAATPTQAMAVKLIGAAANGDLEIKAAEELPFTVNVTQGTRPKLFPIFEDERGFATNLTEGGGQASLTTADRYSGVHAVRVTPEQRFRTQSPRLGIRIKEHPGDGEFRYLRFAWKKSGGKNITLQLNANGSWGPLLGVEGPSFRYQAGEPRGDVAGMLLNEQLPAEWVVITRDLFADFGEFQLDGIALTPSDGEAALFDHIYLAQAEADFSACPPALPTEQPLTIFEDDPSFLDAISYGNGEATLVEDDRTSGTAAVKVTPDQRFNAKLPGLTVKIRQFPQEGEYRFVRFAWKKQGGQAICFQLNHDGVWGPDDAGRKFRYHAGPGPECYGASLNLSQQLPADWVVITRDLYADFGEFTLDGIALSPIDGEFGLFDQIYLGRTPRDFELIGRE